MKLKKCILPTLGYFGLVPFMLGLLSFNGLVFDPIPVYLAKHTISEFIINWYFGGLIAVIIVSPIYFFMIYLMTDNDII